MTYYNHPSHHLLHTDTTMLHDIDNIFGDNMLDSILDSNMPNMGSLNYPETTNNNSTFPPKFQYTEVFRASDMNTAAACVNGVQHLSSPPLSPPITPVTSHDDGVDVDSDCTSCVKCRETATQKRARRREQNRQSQRKFRARKEAKLSDAKSRIRDLEALVKAQEKTNINLKLTIEELNSRHSAAHASARRKAMVRSGGEVPQGSGGSETDAFWRKGADNQEESRGSHSRHSRDLEACSRDVGNQR